MKWLISEPEINITCQGRRCQRPTKAGLSILGQLNRGDLHLRPTWQVQGEGLWPQEKVRGEGGGQHLDLQPGITHHPAGGVYFLSLFSYHCAPWARQSSHGATVQSSRTHSGAKAAGVR